MTSILFLIFVVWSIAFAIDIVLTLAGKKPSWSLF